MPIKRCSEGDKPGFKWGDEGKCYVYTSGDEEGASRAKAKAINQGLAIGGGELKMHRLRKRARVRPLD